MKMNLYDSEEETCKKIGDIGIFIVRGEI